jgi:hypothetical protein
MQSAFRDIQTYSELFGTIRGNSAQISPGMKVGWAGFPQERKW